MERKLNPPFRWDANAMTKLEVSAVRAIDTEACIRIELYSKAHGGERMVQGIDVPFMPTAMHADCISLKNHERKMNKEVVDAVASAVAEANARAEAAEARATQAEARVVALEEATNATLADINARSAALVTENEQLRRQSTAANEVMAVVMDIDRLGLLFPHRPAFAHTLRQKLRAYVAGNYPAFVTATAHKAALEQLATAHAGNVATATKETVKRMRSAFEICTQKLSFLGSCYPEVDVLSALKAVEEALAPFDKI
jgi:hypothetical protein